MLEPVWMPLVLKTDIVPAKPIALWTLVCGYVKGPAKLKIEASGTWEYSPAKLCGPDGIRSSGFLADALIASAPIGVLIGKIGGSAAEKPVDGKSLSFVVGSYTVIALDEKTEGALFLTMNDQIGQFDGHDKEVKIAVQQARS
jgi:hypothetical protein